MQKDYLEYNGRQVRVEANWNAIIAFLEASGQNSMAALSDLSKLKPSDLAGLMAACINEGERLDGRESHLTAQEIGESHDLTILGTFFAIYVKQSTPQVKNEEVEKKD